MGHPRPSCPSVQCSPDTGSGSVWRSTCSGSQQPSICHKDQSPPTAAGPGGTRWAAQPGVGFPWAVAGGLHAEVRDPEARSVDANLWPQEPVFPERTRALASRPRLEARSRWTVRAGLGLESPWLGTGRGRARSAGAAAPPDQPTPDRRAPALLPV